MGGAAFKELLRRRERYDIVLLLRPSKKNRKDFAAYCGQQGISVVWGDLCDPDDVAEAVAGVDHVLHPAALISPEADLNPQACRRVNCGATENIIAAIKKQPGGSDNVRFVYIASVAEYGDRLPPFHMIKVGDPLKPSVGDFYATTKIAAERAVIESGLKHWAVLRQTYIALPDAVFLLGPILFHQPLNTCIELITSEDAGFGLVQTVECPDEFYGRVYNMGGGPQCRVVYQDYLEHMMRLLGLGDYRKVLHPNWFALRNFHCGWYEDSQVLNEYLGHWRQSLGDHYRQVAAATPWYLKVAARIAPKVVVTAFMRRMADPLKWVEKGDEEKTKAFFGSREAWQNIRDWSDRPAAGQIDAPSRQASPVPAGPSDVRALADSRGGQCLSAGPHGPGAKLRWRCGFGHEWEASRTLVEAGHWCPECTPPPWNWDVIATVDPLVARLHYANHGQDERQKVDYLFCPTGAAGQSGAESEANPYSTGQ